MIKELRKQRAWSRGNEVEGEHRERKQTSSQRIGEMQAAGERR
jgi:hypothetical protein